MEFTRRRFFQALAASALAAGATLPVGMPKDRLTLDDLRAAKQMLMENDIGVGKTLEYSLLFSKSDLERGVAMSVVSVGPDDLLHDAMKQPRFDAPHRTLTVYDAQG